MEKFYVVKVKLIRYNSFKIKGLKLIEKSKFVKYHEAKERVKEIFLQYKHYTVILDEFNLDEYYNLFHVYPTGIEIQFGMELDLGYEPELSKLYPDNINLNFVGLDQFTLLDLSRFNKVKDLKLN